MGILISKMLVLPVISKCLAVVVPAIVGSTITTPLLTIADDSIVNSARSGNIEFCKHSSLLVLSDLHICDLFFHGSIFLFQES